MFNVIVVLPLLSSVVLFIGLVSNYEYSNVLVIVGVVLLGVWVLLIIWRYLLTSLSCRGCVHCTGRQNDPPPGQEQQFDEIELEGIPQPNRNPSC